MWFRGSKLIPKNICQFSTKNTSDLLLIPAIVFSLLSFGLSVKCMPTDLVALLLIEIVCMLCRLNSVLFNNGLFYQLDAQILYFNTLITSLYMFQALLCSSSGGHIVWFQHLVLPDLLNLCTEQSPKESDETRCCNYKIWPPEDEHSSAWNM